MSGKECKGGGGGGGVKAIRERGASTVRKAFWQGRKGPSLQVGGKAKAEPEGVIFLSLAFLQHSREKEKEGPFS